MYKKLQDEEDSFSNFDLNFRFLYFMDADNEGIDSRVKTINAELSFNDGFKHGNIKQIGAYEWGCYIFHKDKKSGDLEDILLDLMKVNNEVIFNNSFNFLDTNKLDDNRQKEFVCNNTIEKCIKNSKFKEKKSIISVAGQLQFSGMSNATIIAHSDYIKKSDIANSEHCKQILNLFG